MKIVNIQTILSQFSQGVNWNAFFYAIYKTLFTALSFLLFKFLTAQDFSTWANINSIIFLVLLWSDFGLRKSIPRFYPEFSKTAASLKRFIKILLIFEVTLLLVTTPLIIYLTSNLAHTLNLQSQPFFLYITGAIFFGEGLINLLRLIYHAHFWNKQFNLLATVALLAEMCANIGILIMCTESIDILQGIFITKLCSGLIINIVGIIMLNRLYKDSALHQEGTINFANTMQEFITHSSIMWVNNNLKSLSERNYLVPFFTYLFGTTAANLFKIANDAALFFYRIVLKTIGINDTALLAHVAALPQKKELMPIAFKKLTTQIARLCIPVLGILLLLLVESSLLSVSQFAFQIFFIMAIGYIIELILSPYERILEVYQRYLLLTCAYMPYIVMLIVGFYSNHITYIGLVGSVMIIHSVRLVSSSLMVYFTRTRYHLLFPTRFVFIYSGLCLILVGLISFILYLIIPYFGFVNYASLVRYIR